MNEQELDFRIHCLMCRGRNIVYYRRIDNRPRSQYMHVVRGLRKDVMAVLENIPEGNPKYSEIVEKFTRVVDMIDPKVKSIDCEEAIMTIAEIFMTPEEITILPVLYISENQGYDE